jgi:hypothetical protein
MQKTNIFWLLTLLSLPLYGNKTLAINGFAQEDIDAAIAASLVDAQEKSDIEKAIALSLQEADKQLEKDLLNAKKASMITYAAEKKKKDIQTAQKAPSQPKATMNKHGAPTGLANSGNFCYMNAFLQGVTRVPYVQNKLNKTNQSENLLVESITNIAFKRPFTNGMTHLDVIGSFAAQALGGYGQQDPDEFGRALATVIPFTLFPANSTTISISCEQCQKTTTKTTHETGIILIPCQKTALTTIAKPTTETLYDYRCPGCSRSNSSVKATTQKLNPKHFAVRIVREDAMGRKDATPVIVSEKIAGADVHGIVLHTGRTSRSGHYITLVRDRINQAQWWIANDSVISDGNTAWAACQNGERVTVNGSQFDVVMVFCGEEKTDQIKQTPDQQNPKPLSWWQKIINSIQLQEAW